MVDSIERSFNIPALVLVLPRALERTSFVAFRNRNDCRRGSEIESSESSRSDDDCVISLHDREGVLDAELGLANFQTRAKRIPVKLMNGCGAQRVLVVDDFPDAAEVSSLLLTFLGHDCKIARSGAAALALAERYEFDIAIVDIGLPDLSGYEVARTLRARQKHPMFIAALTGWATESDRSRATEAGFDQHVVKPASREKLTNIIALATTKREPAH